VRKADNLPPSCADVKKSGGLILLEPCGPVQACNGTALHGCINDTRIGSTCTKSGNLERILPDAKAVYSNLFN
jgi:hypothetical protein